MDVCEMECRQEWGAVSPLCLPGTAAALCDLVLDQLLDANLLLVLGRHETLGLGPACFCLGFGADLVEEGKVLACRERSACGSNDLVADRERVVFVVNEVLLVADVGLQYA